MKFRFLKIKPGFIILSIILFIYSEVAVPLIISIFIHETGHLVSLAICRAKIIGIELNLGGCAINYSGRYLSYGQEAFCAAMGPVANLLLSAVSAVLGAALQLESAYTIAGASLTLTIFNLLPITILDGGRVVEYIIEMKYGLQFAEKCMFLSDMVICIGLSVLSMLMVIQEKNNFTILLLTGVLTFSCCNKSRFSVKF